MMFSPARTLKDRFVAWAGGLRFPTLLALTVGLFLVDLAVPDLIPLADEILLGLASILLALLRKRRRPIETEVRPVAGPATEQI